MCRLNYHIAASSSPERQPLRHMIHVAQHTGHSDCCLGQAAQSSIPRLRNTILSSGYPRPLTSSLIPAQRCLGPG